MLQEGVNVVKLVVVCGLYMIVGPTLILINNHILREDDFHFPFFLSAVGILFSFIISWVGVQLGYFQLEPKNAAIMTRKFYLWNILPVGFFMCATLITGNSVYLFLTVSFIQMLKAFTPTIALFVACLFGLENHLSQNLIFSVLGISVGTAVAAYGELNFSVVGVFFMLISEISEVLKLVMMQVLLCDYDFSVIEGLYYLSPAALAWMWLSVVAFELPLMLEENAFDYLRENLFLFFICGVLGFLVHFLSFFVVQLTSSVTLKALALARNAFLVLFCSVVLGETLTSVQLVGYILSLCCFGWYNQIRLAQTNKQTA